MPRSTVERRAKRPRMAAAKPNKKELTTAEVVQLVNGMTRERLEALVLKLHEESTDCSDIIREAMSSTTSDSKRKGFARSRDTMGSLGTLPPEIITMVLSYLTIPERMTVTGLVCKELQSYRWSGSLWTKIDATDIPYNVLLKDILPNIQANNPGCVKNVTLAYKIHHIPKVEKFLSILAKEHNIQTLCLKPGSAVVSQKRLEVFKKLVSSNEGFRNMRDFSLKFTNTSSAGNYSPRFAVLLMELAGWWPKLESFTLDMPSSWRDEPLTFKDFRLLAEAGTELPGAIRGRTNNYITNISVSGGLSVDFDLIINLGRLFPEITHVLLDDVRTNASSPASLKNCTRYEEFVGRLPRLKSLSLKLNSETYPVASDPYDQIVSVVFFSVLFQAPRLTKFTYENVLHNYKPGLFKTAKSWLGGWKGVTHKNLEKLRLSCWSLEWSALGKKRAVWNLPNLTLLQAPHCVTIETDDLCTLMKRGGRRVN
ncbi:hypothetical protein EDC01DRAFT_631829 [Geopyxis carbonaria]|nr:hypothetical protein EDC01DRAFT_631829 [Geopyxis carbonaria]